MINIRNQILLRQNVKCEVIRYLVIGKRMIKTKKHTKVKMQSKTFPTRDFVFENIDFMLGDYTLISL